MAAANTYVPIATQTLASAVASVSFTSIAGTYTDLVLVMQAKNSVGTSNVRLQFNSDTATNYSSTFLDGDGTSAFSSRTTSTAFAYLDNYGQIQNNFNSSIIVNIMNYSNATTYKTILARANNAATGVDAIVSLWRSTAAITSITLTQGGNNYDIDSTFTLYGIKGA
jgi:hypothetical protein